MMLCPSGDPDDPLGQINKITILKIHRPVCIDPFPILIFIHAMDHRPVSLPLLKKHSSALAPTSGVAYRELPVSGYQG